MLPAKAEGNKWVAVRCTHCLDCLEDSYLTTEEKTHTIDHLIDRPKDDPGKQMLAMRFLCKRMQVDPHGFLTFCGKVGDGKSLALTASIAEACRRKIQAQYWNAEDIVRLIMPNTVEVNGELVDEPRCETMFARLATVPWLAIDELDKIKWSEYRDERLGKLIEDRYRGRDSLVTLFAMNKPPEQWPGADKSSAVEAIADRLTDGRFNRPWPDDKRNQLPECLRQKIRKSEGGETYYAPGFFVVDLSSVRPSLQRGTA